MKYRPKKINFKSEFIKKEKITGSCQLCGIKPHVTRIQWFDGSESIEICSNCRRAPIFDKLDDYTIIKAVTKGLEIAHEHNLHKPFAINVALKPYSLEIAKEKNKLRNAAKSGTSLDLFNSGKRQQGGFGNKK